MSYEEEDTCTSYEEEDTCLRVAAASISYEEEDTCTSYYMRRRIHACV
jgi:hypothetical protein